MIFLWLKKPAPGKMTNASPVQFNFLYSFGDSFTFILSIVNRTFLKCFAAIIPQYPFPFTCPIQ